MRCGSLKVFAVFAALCVLASAAFAQTTYELLTSATETSSGGGTAAGFPINTYWHDCRTEQLYLASDLTAAGVTGAGMISAVAIKCAQAPGKTLENVRIRIKGTTATTIGGTYQTGYTQVYGPTSHAVGAFTAGQWITFTFTTPWMWNGTDNILIDYTTDGSSYASGGGCFMRAVSGARSTWGYADSAYSWDFSGMYSGTRTLVPSLRITQDGLSVLTPANLPSASEQVLYTSDILAGQGQQPYNWTMLSGSIPTNMTLTQVNVGGINRFRLAGTPPTGSANNYSFTVQVTDGAANTSTKQMFLYVSPPPASLPFADDFSTDKNWQLPSPWARGSAVAYSATGPNRSEPGTDHSATTDNMIIGHRIGLDYFDNMGATDWATSPPVDCSAAANVRLRFWRYLGISLNDQATIQVSNNGSTWTTVFLSPSGSTINDTAWTPVSYDITPWAAGFPVVQVRFGVGPTDGTIVNTGWCIDDFVIEEPSTDLLFQENGAAGAPITDNAAPAGIRDFGTVAAGANNSITIYMTNNGPTPVTFGGGGNPPYAKTGANPGQFYMPDWNTVPNPLQPGASAPFTITFNSGSTGTFACTIEIYHNAAYSGFSPFQINLTATAIVPQPIVRANFGSATGPLIPHQDPATSANGRDFGNRDINSGASPTITIFITNAGTGTLSISTPQMGGTWWTEYVVNSTGMVSQLTGGASTSFTVAFDPASVGQKNADVIFAHTDGTQPSPFYIPVTGNGTSTPAPIMDLQQGTTSIADGGLFNAGTLAVGQPAGLGFSVRNIGGVALNLVGSPAIQLGSQVSCTAAITVNPASTTIGPGGAVSFTIEVTPLVAGMWSFAISIANDDPFRNPYDVTISGNGVSVATELRVLTQPTDSDAGELLTTAPVVGITDAAGNVDTSDNTTQVQVSITSGTGNASAILAGLVTVTAVNGVVTFPDLVVSHGGSGYTLTFTDITGPLGTVDSDPFNVAGGGGGSGDDEEEEACSTGSGAGAAVPLTLLAACLILWRRRRA